MEEGFDLPKMNSELLEPRPAPSSIIQTWKIFAFLLGLIIFLFVSSAVICGTDQACVNNIPTIKNMLNSTFATPFLVSGLNSVLCVHLVTSTFLYFTTVTKAPYFSHLQLISAILIYTTCVLTLFVLPFVGWTQNWCNVVPLIAMAIWMAFVQISLKRTRHKITMLSVCMILYMVCVLIYIVVRAVPDIPLEGKDIGILVVEIAGAISLIIFTCICVTHIYKMSIHIVAIDRCD